jgi:hypothetical protein
MTDDAQSRPGKTYTGYREHAPHDGTHAVTVKVHVAGKEPRILDPRLDLRNHSPTGFEWGYAGSGPAQLSLALAADVLGDDDRARDIYQSLKFKLVGRLPKDGWTLTETALRDAIEQLEAERGRDR